MKPIKLELEGLNSFESKQELDFTKLGSGVFGIFGKTGSGKSTILDAITLALYGEVSRSKQNIDFINTKCKKATVSLWFEILVSGKTKKYLVSRTFSIRKNGKDVESTALLFELDGEDKNLISEGSFKVNEKVFEIVGLGQNEFSKCIALPQGEFSAFLKAKQSERTEIMSNIFDLSKYGEKLYAKVKKKLNDFDRDVASLTAKLQLVDYATDEVLSEAKEKFFTSSVAYEKVKDELKEKSETYAKFKESLEKRQKLLEVSQTLESLEKQAESIKDLELKIEKHQVANSVKFDFEKLQKTTEDEKNLSSKIAELNEVKLKAESELASENASFDDFKQIYDSKIVELNTKLSKLDDLLGLESEEIELRQSKSKVEGSIDEVKLKISKRNDDLAYTISCSDKIDEQIDEIEQFIDMSRPDVNLSYALEQTKGIESEIILIDDFYARVEALVDQTNDDLKSVQEEYNSSIAQEKELSEKHEKIEKSIEVAFEDCDTTNFKKLRSCDSQLEEMREVQVLNQKLDEIVKKLENDCDERSKTIAALEDEITIAQNELTSIESQISNEVSDINKARDEREEVLGENFFTLVTNQLSVGDNCPICGNVVSKKSYGETADVKQLASNINSAENHLKSTRFERDKILTNLISLKAKSIFEKTQIENNLHEIEAIKGQKTKLYQRFVDINENSVENFNRLYEIVSNTAESLETLISLQDELRVAEQRVVINKTQSGTKLTLYKNYLESLIDVLYDLQKKKAEREFAIYNLSEKYKNLNEFKKQIADGKNAELLIDSKKEEKQKLKEQQRNLLAERELISKDISTFENELAVLSERLSSIERQQLQVKSKILENGVPEGVMISDEQQKVREAIAKLKFDLEDKESKLVSSRELLSRTENEYNVTFSILSNKRLEKKSLETSVSEAMKQGEFSNSDELQSYFISPNDLKSMQNKIVEHNSSLRIAEVQKQELENSIGEVVDEADVLALKSEIEQLNSNVQSLSESVGKNSAEFARIEDDNKKLKNLKAELKIAQQNYDLAKELSSVLKGKALAEYVAEEYLQQITTVANQKLNLLMDGRFNLIFENREFVVEDNFNDGLKRPAGTLSGGETFLVSLSLAFSISDAISMLSSRNMEFFFLDEGFGTLDSELCEAVVSALYKLESQNLKIGLISHVAELEESIKNRVYITKTQTGSKIRLEQSL